MNTARVNAGRHPVWFRSSYSNGAGGECLECASTGDKVLVRDSKLEAGPVITLAGVAWHAFMGGVVGTDV
ncbi:hypothetical protein RKD27_005693 [Streptomyces sp. SAI-126]|uniref:DUF397 domain-containing protein n=1 Tax=unclassified Streptomyces TaxID=2593676 RepID=UPI00235B469A|nr:DUF397 domain-containing protein [Streptomyces sp. TUS-ST3]GLP65530.1 hypothetical protein TUSST3_21500 [Streptomyces sp. TUS-ST3]